MPKPADPLSDTLYDMPTLNRLFFVSSLLLIATTVWMAWQDYDRNWKHFQRDFNAVAFKKAAMDRDRAEAELDKKYGAELSQLKTDLAAAETEAEKQKPKVEEATKGREKIRGKLEKSLQAFQFAKSESDTFKYKAEKARVAAEEAKARGEGGAGVEKDREAAQAKFDELDTKTKEAKKAWEEVNFEDQKLVAVIDEIFKKTEDTKKKIAKLETDLASKKRNLMKLEPNWQKDLLNAPGMDFIAPTEKIQQLILPHFLEDVNFSSVYKVDRCTTCHLAIDKAKGWTKEDLPPGTSPAFFSHPNLELYVGDNSPHPMSKFGCTICHNGQGRSVDFIYASHTPKDEEQAKQWKEEYNWSPVEHYDSPMLPTQYAQAACTKCHGAQHRITMADKLNEGKRLVETVGCFGCHPIAGTEGLRKPGPSLYGVKYKVSKDWVFNWVSKPTDFRPTTKMPQPFFLSNTSDDESKKRNTVMIQGIIEYLWENENLPGVAEAGGYPAPPPGNAAHGKKVIESVGCVGCHVIEGFTEKGNRYRSFGPNLTSVGSKLKPGWIYAWVRDPKQYFPGSAMPKLRLTDEEAADATAYLVTLKHPDHFEDRKEPEVDDQALHSTMVEFMKGQMSLAEAEEQVSNMNQHQQLLKLGFKAISQMGCFGCHDIKGFEKTKLVGAELTGSNSTGTKDITKFDFGFHENLQHSHHPIPNDRIAWVREKLKNPRTFDDGRIVPYFDKLRMPKFNLKPEEVESITTYVLSFRRETVNPLFIRTLSNEDAVINAGKRQATISNCGACHKIGVWPTTVALTGNEDENNGSDIWGLKVYAARQILTDGRQVERISEDELAILAKKGISILVKKGTWLAPDVVTQLIKAGMKSVLVFGEGEGGIKELVEKNPEDMKAPPIIVGEGAKVNPDWLFRFLKSPFEIRPWLANKDNPGVRMPTFGFSDEQALTLVEHFARLSGQQFPFTYREPLAEEERQKLIAAGKVVFEANSCAKCHVVKGKTVTTQTPAPAFAGVGPRIQWDWFDRWIRDPQSIAPGVSMTAYSLEQVKPEDVPALKEFIWSLSEQEKK